MVSKEKKSSPNEELQHAIADLNLFVKQNNDAAIPTLTSFDVQDGHLVIENPSKRMIELTRHFFGSVFSENVKQKELRKHNKVRQTLLKAVATVSIYYPLIEKLKRGNTEEKDFAEEALKVINRYNATITKDAKESSSWTARIVDYLHKQNLMSVDEELRKSVIVLPTTALYESQPTLSSKKIQQETILSFPISKQFSNATPSQHEKDAFTMKAITLIHKHEIPASIQETVCSLKTAPIFVKQEELATERHENSQPAIISLQQILTPFPGEVIKLTGSFKRTPQASLLSTPIPESFSMASQSTQTAFPHPLQHSGWALADALIPHYPLRPDQLPLLHPLAQKKRDVAYGLLPKGHLRTKAKQLIEAKKTAFDHDSDFFLSFHKAVSLSILSAAGKETANNETIDSFYAYVKNQSSPYECLSNAYETLNERCITSLYQRLHHEWLDKNHPGLQGTDNQKKFQCALALMEDELTHSLNELKHEVININTLNYILTMGHLIGDASASIILQAMSEKIGMAPPMLTDFEQKIQSCALSQIIHFLNEVSGSPIENAAARMEESLKYEAALFHAASFDDLTDSPAEISNELEVYYNSRFYTAKKLS
jgi:hypothetical protein